MGHQERRLKCSMDAEIASMTPLPKANVQVFSQFTRMLERASRRYSFVSNLKMSARLPAGAFVANSSPTSLTTARLWWVTCLTAKRLVMPKTIKPKQIVAARLGW